MAPAGPRRAVLADPVATARRVRGDAAHRAPRLRAGRRGAGGACRHRRGARRHRRGLCGHGGGGHHRRAARTRPRLPPPHRRGHRQRPAGLHRQHAVAGAARVDQALQPAPEHARALAAAPQGHPHRAAGARPAGGASGHAGAAEGDRRGHLGSAGRRGAVALDGRPPAGLNGRRAAHPAGPAPPAGRPGSGKARSPTTAPRHRRRRPAPRGAARG